MLSIDVLNKHGGGTEFFTHLKFRPLQTNRSKIMKYFNRYRILYAEDNEDSRDLVSMMCELSDINVMTTETVAETWQMAQSERFDLYLLDSRFPDGDGLELCRKLREFNSQTPIVFYSGDAREIDKANGLAAGADAYLVKPNTDSITATIFQLLKHTSKTVYQTI
jgi:DNA-binding response OmpR family regulator